MQISTCQSSRSFPIQTGFTLIEVLVVLFIVSIMTGLVIMQAPRISGHDSQLEEAQRLLAVLRMAGDEAMMTGQEIGLEVSESDYSFVYYDFDKDRWLGLDAPPLQPRALASEFILRLTLDERTIEQDGEDQDEEDQEDVPAVIISASGEVTPFHLQVLSRDRNGAVFTLANDGISGFELEDPLASIK